MRVPFLLHAAGVLTALIVGAGSASAAKLSPLGVWYDHTGRGAVEIKACGSRLCGRVVWAKSKKDSKKGCGKKIIDALRPLGRGVWGGGRIYSPEQRTTYDVEVRPLSRNKLRVLGYMGSKIFSKTMYWKRAPRDLVRCDRPAPATQDAPIIAQKKKKKQPAAAANPPSAHALNGPSVRPKTASVPATAPAKTAAVTPPSIVPPQPARAQRDTSTTERGTTKSDSSGGVQTGEGSNEGRDAPRVAARDGSRAGNLETSEPDAVDSQQQADSGDDEDPDTPQRTARYKKKRCIIKVPFVTISIPCAD